MRKITLLLMLILSVQLASAEILLINPNKELYNWGDKLQLSYTVTSEEDANAIFKESIICGNELDYYVSPISLTAQEPRNIEVQELSLQEPLLGPCTARAQLVGLDNSVSDELSTSQFTITNEIPITIQPSSFLLNPKDMLGVSGSVRLTYTPFRGTTIRIKLDDDERMLTITKPSFNVSYLISPTMKSGTHTVTVSASDAFGNRGNATVKVIVNQVASRVMNLLDKDTLAPQEKLSFSVLLLDQASDQISSSADVELLSPNGEQIYLDSVQTGKHISVTIGQFYKPGSYTLHSKALGLEAESKILVTELSKLVASFDNRTVTISNLGNIAYNGPAEVTLTEGKSYPITISRKLSLEPGASVSIDLYSEAPAGNYAVAAKVAGEGTSLGMVNTVDKRSAAKLTADLVSDLTSHAIGSGKYEGQGVLMKRPVLAALIILAVVAGTTVFYAKLQQQRRNEAHVAQEHAEAEHNIAKIKASKDEPEEKEADSSLRENPDIQRFIRDQLKGN